MEDIVAVAVELKNGECCYFLTWGRIQHTVNPRPLEKLVLAKSNGFALGGKALSARVCCNLQEASGQPFFYECFFSMCQERIPFGVETYEPWRKSINKQMRSGNELYFLGNSKQECRLTKRCSRLCRRCASSNSAELGTLNLRCRSTTSTTIHPTLAE